MTPIEITLTNAGLQALINAQASGTAAVAITSYGVSDVALAATPDMTTLPNERKRVGTVSGGIVSPNTIHVVLQDTGDDAYTLRAFALYLSDGTLFGIYGQADPILIKTAGADMLIANDIQFVNTDVTNIVFGSTNFFNPPATETVVGVARIATQDEVVVAADDRTIVTPKKLANAGYARRAGDTFTGPIGVTTSAGDASLTLNRGGAVIGVLVAQGDRNLVLYRNDGGGPVPVFGINSQSGPFAVAMPITRMGYTVWDAGNDGAGSGLDADLLDGQDGGFYRDIPARLGYAPANRAGDAFTGDVSVVHAGNVSLVLNASGAVIARLVAQADGNIVLYRNTGSGDAMVWSCDGSQLNAGFPIVRQGQKVWDAGNDGAGSGLDADLLDGRDSGFFTDIAARLGYVPANRAGDAFTGDVSVVHTGGVNLTLNSSGVVIAKLVAQADGTVALYRNAGGGDVVVLGSDGVNLNAGFPILRQGQKVWDAGNDGAGSGLDADLLDGRDSGFFTDIAARLGYVPANRAGDTFTGDVSVVHAGNVNLVLNSSGVVIAKLVAQADGSVALYRSAGGADAVMIGSDGVNLNAGFPILRQGQRVWDAGNDGAGSGLDADLLDGREASSFANAGDFGFGTNPNGYWEKRPNGIIEQWGSVGGRTSEGTVAITFPIAFTDPATVRLFPVGVNLNASDRYDVSIQRVSITAEGAVVFCQYSANSNSQAVIDQIDWRAIGR